MATKRTKLNIDELGEGEEEEARDWDDEQKVSEQIREKDKKR